MWGYTRSIVYSSQGMFSVRDTHNRAVIHSDTFYRPTTGEYDNMIDHASGKPTVMSNYIAAHWASLVGETGVDAGLVPELYHWSDIAYLQ